MTWFGVRSGNASVVMVANAHVPAAASASVAAITNRRCSMDLAMSHSIALTLHLHLRHVHLLDLRLYRERAGNDNDITGNDATRDRHPSAAARAHFDLATFEARTALSIGAGEKHERLALHLLHRVFRNAHRNCSRCTLHDDGCKHLRFEPAGRIVDQRAHEERTRT